MDRRKKRTSTNQYIMYIEMMENDRIFATGRVPRDGDMSYLQKKWKELADKLNTCSGGPRLTAEEWRKRLNDWKNTTRCKYRRSLSDEKDITLTSLEQRALALFGTAPHANLSSDQVSLHLKSEKEDEGEHDDEMEQHRTSEAFQKELQAAVEEAIGNDDDDEDALEETEENEEVLSDPMSSNIQTIVVENANYGDEDNEMEFITQRRHTTTSTPTTVTTSRIQTSTPTTTANATVTKLINGDLPLKRLRTQAPDQIIYEVKKAASAQPTQRTITLHNTAAGLHSHPQSHGQAPAQHQHQHATTTTAAAAAATINANTVVANAASDANPSGGGSTIIAGTLATTAGAGGIALMSQDARELTRQLKRLADIKSEKLRFEIARFKFNNPGFNYLYPNL